MLKLKIIISLWDKNNFITQSVDINRLKIKCTGIHK